MNVTTIAERPETLEDHFKFLYIFYDDHPICVDDTNFFRHVGYSTKNQHGKVFGPNTKVDKIHIEFANLDFGEVVCDAILGNTVYFPNVKCYKLEHSNGKSYIIIDLANMEMVTKFWDIIHNLIYNMIYRYGLDLTREFIMTIHKKQGGVDFQKEAKWHKIFKNMRTRFEMDKDRTDKGTGISFTEKDSYMTAKVLKNLGFVQFNYGNSVVRKNLIELFVFKDKEDEQMLNIVGQVIKSILIYYCGKLNSIHSQSPPAFHSL
jgi:hypothetical protein